MLEKVKMALRITTDAFNEEITDLIASAMADISLIGIVGTDTDPLIRKAVITYCRMNFGAPVDYDKLKASYDEQKAQLQTASGYHAPEVSSDGSRKSFDTCF